MGLDPLTMIAIAAVASAGATGYQAYEARGARKDAEAQAAEERARLAELQKQAELPIPDDEEARRARRRSLAGLMRRRGRLSTILTNTGAGGGDTLGA